MSSLASVSLVVKRINSLSQNIIKTLPQKAAAKVQPAAHLVFVVESSIWVMAKVVH